VSIASAPNQIEDIRQSVKDQFGPMAKHRINHQRRGGDGKSKASDAWDGISNDKRGLSGQGL